MNNKHAFYGCIPALMTPCSKAGVPDFEALVRKGKELIEGGMSSVVYCGSMGDWPLLSEEQRQQGVSALIDAGIPVIVGTGAQNTNNAVSHATHAKASGA
ncbi:MAG: dihydrodipicolinate synthase family protein, partial [SAR324 cluster bacterium]|nr:dihydrodipicolinate synthase family protein [SAR324 cluster bacterium]